MDWIGQAVDIFIFIWTKVPFHNSEHNLPLIVQIKGNKSNKKTITDYLSTWIQIEKIVLTVIVQPEI